MSKPYVLPRNRPGRVLERSTGTLIGFYSRDLFDPWTVLGPCQVGPTVWVWRVQSADWKNLGAWVTRADACDALWAHHAGNQDVAWAALWSQGEAAELV